MQKLSKITFDARDSDPQILQTLDQEIGKLKHQVSQKDKVIEE